MSVAIFQVNLRTGGDFFHVAAEGFHFGDEQEKFNGVNQRARVVVFDGLVEFLHQGASAATPSPTSPSLLEDPCYIPNYYYIPADEVSSIIPVDQSTFGVPAYGADFPPDTAPTVDPDRYYGWVVYLNSSSGPCDYTSPYGAVQRRQRWLAKSFDFRDKTEADQYVKVKQARTQLVLNFVGSVGPIATLGEPSEYYPDLNTQYYLPITSIAAVLPITGPIHIVNAI